MKKVIMNRGTGKTYQLLLTSGKTGATIVCSHKTLAANLVEYALQVLDLEIPTPITYAEFKKIIKGQEGCDAKGFLIDDADYLLKTISPIPIAAISMSLDD